MLQTKIKNESWIEENCVWQCLICTLRMQTYSLWSETTTAITRGAQEALFFCELHKAMTGGFWVEYSQNCLLSHDFSLSQLLLYGDIASFLVACLLPPSFAAEGTWVLLLFYLIWSEKLNQLSEDSSAVKLKALPSSQLQWAWLDRDVALLPVGQAGLWRAKIPQSGRLRQQLSSWLLPSRSLLRFCHESLVTTSCSVPQRGRWWRFACGHWCVWFFLLKKSSFRGSFWRCHVISVCGDRERAECLQDTESSDRWDLFGHVEG